MSQRYLFERLVVSLTRLNCDRKYSHYNLNGKHNLKPGSLQFARSSRNSSELKCWKCGIERKNASDLFCEECHTIQNPHEKDNYFKIFNLDVTYDVNQKTLTNSYRKMQSVLHPDKFSNKSDVEQQISAEYSSLVNKAYETLQTPINRAIHLLLLNNESITEDNISDQPEFLMEMMELNEQIDEADDSPEKLKELARKNTNMLNKYSLEISDCFKRGQINEAKEAVIKMKYYTNISKRINNLMREKGIVD